MIAGPEQSGREESPDTDLRQQGMGNAPGNARGAVAQTLVCASCVRLEKRPPAERTRTKACATVHGKCHRK